MYANRAYNRLSGHPQEAKDDCDEALRLDPNLLPALFTRAAIHLRMYHRNGTAIPLEATPAEIDRVMEGLLNVPDVWNTAGTPLHPCASVAVCASCDKAAQAVLNAISAGMSPDAVRRSSVLKTALAGHPVYEQALTLPPGRVDTSINPHLANTIP